MSVSSARSTLTHSTFPSISSTLSHLEERETEVEKRSGVYVTDAERRARTSSDDMKLHNPVLHHFPTRKSSKELLKLQSYVSVADADSTETATPSSASQKTRSNVPSLSSSHSSPQLRTLADLASTPASPLRTVSQASTATSTTTTRVHTLTRSHTFPVDTDDYASDIPLSPTTLAALSSRWSLDSTRSGGGRPALSPVAEDPSPPESPMKPRKRDRLISFISRNRAGSIGKTSQPSPIADSEYADLVGFQPDFFVAPKRDSRISSQPSSSSLNLPIQQPTTPMPISTANSLSSSSSTSTLPTPVDGASHDILPRSSFFASEPSSYLPDLDDGEYEPDTEPLEPTLPLPSPSIPTTSFLTPQRPQSAFPFLSTFRRKNRRHKKLVVSQIPYFPNLLMHGREEDAGVMDERREAMRREQRTRYDAVVKWCESFGALRRVERRVDGSLHIHWKEWEAADMVSFSCLVFVCVGMVADFGIVLKVCRIQGQVFINDVGTVSLAWHYLK
ncbi:hypothetical protein EUX98_g8220 [Antrodiella citrinella]|uniref:Uncharacterized protein n=1 Tax=Antrodiella citrinella TaxID=2447956 RepID=A0A4V3XGR0_9APHY|nr:hypothetical protein EUX98_g8220 [Antrodiella citrinella]